MTTVKEIGTVDDAVLATLDFGIGVDHSASTDKPSHRLPGKTRYQEMQEDAGRIIRAMSKFDSDGLTLVMFSRQARTIDGVTPDRIESVFREHQPGGSTNLSACIRALTAKAAASAKDFVGVIWTDGEADDEDDVVKSLREAAQVTKGRPKFGLVIVQTGNDPAAAAFLRKLDDQLASKGIPDMVSVVTEDESEGLNVNGLAWLAQNA